MGIIKNIIFSKAEPSKVKIEIDSKSLFRFIGERIFNYGYDNNDSDHPDVDYNNDIDYSIYDSILSNKEKADMCFSYIETALNNKHTNKEIGYRTLPSFSQWGRETHEIINYFIYEDKDSCPDYFIDSPDITEDIIWELYCEYINTLGILLEENSIFNTK